MPINNYIYSTTVPSDLTGIYIPAIQRNIKALAGAAEQTAKKRGDKKASLTFKKAKNQAKKSSNKTPRLIEETNAQSYLDNNMIDLGNNIKVSPYELYNSTHPGAIYGISEDLWNEQRPTGLKWVDLSNSIPDNAWYSFLKEPLRTLGYNRFHNRDLLTAGERVALPALMSAAGGTSIGTGGEASLNLLGDIGKWVLGTELVNLSTKPFTGSSISLTASHYLPISEKGAHEAMILGAPGAVKGAVKGGEKAFNWGTMKAAELGYKPAMNYTLSRTINNATLRPEAGEYLYNPQLKFGGFINPNFVKMTYDEPWSNTWKNPYTISYRDPKAVNEIPRGVTRKTTFIDTRDPSMNLSSYLTPVFNPDGTFKGYSQEYIQRPTISRTYNTNRLNLSGGKGMKQTIGIRSASDNEKSLFSRFLDEINPNVNLSINPNDFRISTPSATRDNLWLLEGMKLSLRDKGINMVKVGTLKASKPYSTEKTNVDVYGPARGTSRPLPLSELELYEEVFNDNMATYGEPPEEAFIPKEANLDPITEHPSVRNLPRGAVISNATAKRLLLEGYNWYDDILPNFRVDYPLEGEVGVRPSYNDLRLAALNARRRTGLPVGFENTFFGEPVLHIPGLEFRVGSAARTGMSNVDFLFDDPIQTDPSKVIEYMRYVNNPILRLAELLAQRARGLDLAHIGDILGEDAWHLSAGSYGKGMEHVFKGIAGDKIILPYPVQRGNLNRIGSVVMFDHNALRHQSPDLYRRIIARDPNLSYRVGLKDSNIGEAFDPVQIIDENGNMVGKIRSTSNDQLMERVNRFIKLLGDKKWNVGTEEAPVYRTAREAFESPNSPYRDPNNPYRNKSFDDVLKMFLLKPGIDPNTGMSAPGLFEAGALTGMQIRKKGGKLIKRIKY